MNNRKWKTDKIVHTQRISFSKKYDNRPSMKLYTHILSRYIFFIYISLGFTLLLPGWWTQLPRNKALVNIAIWIRGVQQRQTPEEKTAKRLRTQHHNKTYIGFLCLFFFLPNRAKISLLTVIAVLFCFSLDWH